MTQTNELRFVLRVVSTEEGVWKDKPFMTTTKHRILQQKWITPYPEGVVFEWRDVPTGEEE